MKSVAILRTNKEYLSVIADIKHKIKKAQYKAILSANSEMVLLYWQIGGIINSKAFWGSKFIDNLAKDIKNDFPFAKGYSVRNLKYMAKFAKIHTDAEFVQVALAQITWYHHITLMDKIKDAKAYLWYVSETIKNGWSRNVLVHQIESELYKRQIENKKVSNFAKTLDYPQNELATQTLKDQYIFDFIDFRDKMIEREIENELVKNVTKLLLELGEGFAFIGNQYHLEIGNDDFYIDLLFYNLNLRCYVVIELKTGEFKAEYAGKLNFYLSAVDSVLKKDCDNASIGILLCKTKNNIITEFALKDMSKPIGVSEYKIFKKLPGKYKNIFPAKKEIEQKLGWSSR
ncbi:MAG: PDDEXK nuclease domain-containing protein [Fibromonadales bacterium]|nr:PDDEXK nuclease domain-containing protein [Fibromonadales bacterium]